MRYIKRQCLMVLACLLFILSVSVVADAATKTEINDVARSLLSEYYEPADCLDTCVYNIENCYSQEPYINKDQQSSIYAKADSLVANAKNNKEKVKLIHDWMCTTIHYADDLSGYNGYPYSDLANPYTVFKNKQAVCYGYANLTQMMLQHVGVPCVIVRGNSSSHVWNAVYLDGQWVFTDNTWDENLTSGDKISYKYYLMNNETYDNSYSTQFIENWAGDACYFPVYVTTSYNYHEIILNSKGGKCRSKIPFSENMNNFTLPIPEREGRTFSKWTNDHDIAGYYYANFGGWYISDGVRGVQDDIIYTAVYTKVNPTYEIPTDIIAYKGDTLTDVALPNGFAWMDGSQKLNEIGTFEFKAKYIPEDIDDYNIVNNIIISVEVKEISADIINEGKEILNAAQEKLSTSNNFESGIFDIVNALSNEYDADKSLKNNVVSDLETKSEAVHTALTKASESVANAEDVYSKYTNNTATESAAKAALNAAQGDINNLKAKLDELNSCINNGNSQTSSLPSVNGIKGTSVEDLEAELQELGLLRSNVRAVLSGLERYANNQDSVSDELSELISDLSSCNSSLNEVIIDYNNDKANIEEFVSDINKFRNELQGNLDTAKIDASSVNKEITSMQKRLDKLPSLKIKLNSKNISMVKTLYIYTGKSYSPGVTVKGLTKGKDYTVSYSNNKYAGTGKVILTGIGKYTGTVTRTFSITTPKPTLVKASVSKKIRCKMKVKALSGITKYQVAYKVKGSSKWSYKTVSVKSNTLTLTGLKHKKKYQVKVRAIVPCDAKYSKVKYSTWTKTKTIKTK